MTHTGHGLGASHEVDTMNIATVVRILQQHAIRVKTERHADGWHVFGLEVHGNAAGITREDWVDMTHWDRAQLSAWLGY